MQQSLIDFISREQLGTRADVSIQADDDLLGSGLIDSLGIMRLIAFIEEQYGVSVPPQDVTIENFETVSAISAYLEKRVDR